METRRVGTKLRPKASTSVSVGDSWWEEGFLMALFLKLVKFLKFLEDPTFSVSEV